MATCPSRWTAMKAGAVDFIEKPFDDEVLSVRESGRRLHRHATR
jgi:FixJ family two-component response regulator